MSVRVERILIESPTTETKQTSEQINNRLFSSINHTAIKCACMDLPSQQVAIRLNFPAKNKETEEEEIVRGNTELQRFQYFETYRSFKNKPNLDYLVQSLLLISSLYASEFRDVYFYYPTYVIRSGFRASTRSFPLCSDCQFL